MPKNWIKELQQDAPVLLMPFVEQLGLQLSNTELPKQIVGYFDAKCLELNKGLDQIGQRHTLSFLLSHVLMHKEFIFRTGSHVSHLMDSTLGQIPDLNARSLAANILMPDHLIETYLSELDIERAELRYGHKTFLQLADHLRVSQMDLAKRLNVVVPFTSNGLSHG